MQVGGEWKKMFSVYTTLLVRLMQKEMGYRDYVKNSETATCPECGNNKMSIKNVNAE